MEAEKTTCFWPGCGEPLDAKRGARIARCSECCRVNCLQCKATHEGVSCAVFQANRGQAGQSTLRSPTSLGARSKSYDTWSPAARDTSASEGNRGTSKNSPRSTGASEEPTWPSPSWANASASLAWTGTYYSGAATRKSTSPVKPPVEVDQVTRSEESGTSLQRRRAICLTEDCGYEKEVNANDTELFCYKCRKTTCLRCNAIHGYVTCEEYRRQLDDQEDEIQVWCAAEGCPFTAFVGASTQQLKCAQCERITCIKCSAVHEFLTCEAYERERRRSSGVRPREATAAAPGGAGETHPKEESTAGASWDNDSESFDRAPAHIAASEPDVGRGVSRKTEVLIQQAPSNSHRSETVSEHRGASPVTSPKATTTVSEPGVLMVECCSCAAESNIEEIIEVLPCAHFLCRDCAHTTGVGSLTYLVRCPVTMESGISCDSYIQESALKSVMTEEEYQNHKELVSLPVHRCLVEGCSGKFSLRPGTQSLRCPSCRSEYCATCTASHSGQTCEQFIRAVADGVGAVGVHDENEYSGHLESSLSQPPSSDDESVECCGCLAETPFEEMIAVHGCGHLICRGCIRGIASNVTGASALCPAKSVDGTPCNTRMQDSALQTVAAGGAPAEAERTDARITARADGAEGRT